MGTVMQHRGGEDSDVHLVGMLAAQLELDSVRKLNSFLLNIHLRTRMEFFIHGTWLGDLTFLCGISSIISDV